MKIKTERLILRNLEDKDAKDLVEGCNNLNVSRYLAVVPHPYKLKDAKWIINHTKEQTKKKPREDYELGIEKNGKIIGVVSITKVNKYNGTASTGFWLNEKYWRQGIMSEALTAMINFAFKKLKLRRINSAAYAKNKGSRMLQKKLGFKEEGYRRKYNRAKATGKIFDQVDFGLLKEYWKRK